MVSPRTCSVFFGRMLVLCAGISIFWVTYVAAEPQKASLSANSKLFNIWKETRTTRTLEVYFFNITNVDDILAKKEGIKLQVKEIGPYVFWETSKKTNLTWNRNSTLTFYNQKWWHFVPWRSDGSLSDKIVNVNPILEALSYKKRHSSFFQQLAINQVIAVLNKDFFLSANVSSWLFDGISDSVQEITKPIFGDQTKFAWFYNRNGSVEYDGSLTINTGAIEPSLLGNVEAWRFSNRTAFRDECGEVKGFTGDLSAPEYTSRQEEMPLFSPHLCT